LYKRVVPCFLQIAAAGQNLAVVTHGGVIRSILSHITQTPLIDSFTRFPLHFGCVVKITAKENEFRYEIISNVIPPESEKHKPSYFRSKS
ncbi:MAG TPA: histidine phosphatase family protein, partial [Puia sp.]|nr:histidine phosphatase family protein [Puia sp.]